MGKRSSHDTLKMSIFKILKTKGPWATSLTLESSSNQ